MPACVPGTGAIAPSRGTGMATSRIDDSEGGGGGGPPPAAPPPVCAGSPPPPPPHCHVFRGRSQATVKELIMPIIACGMPVSASGTKQATRYSPG